MHLGAFSGVLDADHLAGLMNPVQKIAAGIGHQGVDLDGRTRQAFSNPLGKGGQPFPGARGDEDRLGELRPQRQHHLRSGRVELVHHELLGNIEGTDVGQHLPDCSDLTEGVGVRPIHHVHQEISFD